jgi:hypothetical protein
MEKWFILTTTFLGASSLFMTTFFPNFGFLEKSALASGRSSRFCATSLKRLRFALVVIPTTWKGVKQESGKENESNLEESHSLC